MHYEVTIEVIKREWHDVELDYYRKLTRSELADAAFKVVKRDPLESLVDEDYDNWESIDVDKGELEGE